MHFMGCKLENDEIIDTFLDEKFKIVKPPHLPRTGVVFTDETHAAVIAYPYAYIFRYVHGAYYYIDEILLVAELPRELCIHHTSIAVSGANHVISICAGDCESDEHSVFIQVDGKIATVMHTFAIKYVFTTMAAIFMIYETYIEIHSVTGNIVKKCGFDFHQFERFNFIDDQTLQFVYNSGELLTFKL